MDDQNQIDSIVGFILNYIIDPHPKVRYSVMHAIGQISDDLRPDFQKKHHEKIFNFMLQALSKETVPRVTSHILAALTNFLEGCSQTIVKDKIQTLVDPCL